MIQLTKEQAEEIQDRIRGLMHHWHPNPQTSDFRCEFCGETANTNRGEITHLSHCDGQRFLNYLQEEGEITHLPHCDGQRFLNYLQVESTEMRAWLSMPKESRVAVIHELQNLLHGRHNHRSWKEFAYNRATRDDAATLQAACNLLQSFSK